MFSIKIASPRTIFQEKMQKRAFLPKKCPIFGQFSSDEKGSFDAKGSFNNASLLAK